MKVQNLENPLCCISSSDLHIMLQVWYLLELQGIHIHLSESIPKLWMSIKPRHAGHSGAILSATLQLQGDGAGYGRARCVHYPSIAEMPGLVKTEEPDHKFSGNASSQRQQQLWAGLEVGCKEVQSTCPVPSQDLL